MLSIPIHAGKLQLANRLVMPPLATENCTDGMVTENLITHYEKRAGKIGLIICEHAYIEAKGQASKGQLRLDHKADMDGLKELVKRVHVKGQTKIVQQISHCGDLSRVVKDRTPVNDLTLDDMKRIKQAFVEAALRVKEAGFDGVEVHAAHGYLLSQFYSPLTNQREGSYGSSPENRLRFILEVIADVRKAVGADYPLLVRFGGCDYKEGGSDKKDVPHSSKLIQETGCDLLDISGGLNGFLVKGAESDTFVELSQLAKQTVDIPVLVAGGIRGKEHMNELLAQGACDLIGYGRPLMKDVSEIDLLL